MVEQQDTYFTFSDEDFERRYSTEEASSPSSGADGAAHPAAQGKSVVAQLVRSRNRYMRTLLRRRLLSSAS